MRRVTIVPGQHPGNPDVDPEKTERWAPSSGARRMVDSNSASSGFPRARRFETIYPPSSEDEDGWMLHARDHDRAAPGRLAGLLEEDMSLTVQVLPSKDCIE